MKPLTRLLLGSLLSVVLCSATFAAGSGAYRIDVPDAASLAMGGAFVGQADSSAAVFYNPAGMTQLTQPEAAVNMALIQPKGNATLPDGTDTKMQRDSFLIPTVSYATKVGDSVAFGLGATSSWGLSTEWAQDSFARYVNTRTSLKNQDYIIAAAYKLNEQVSLGLGLTIDQSTISKEKKIYNLGFGDPGEGNFKLAGDNTAAGFQVSGLYKVNEQHQFGVQYTSPIHRKYHGKVHLDGLGPITQSLYGFSGSSYETDVVSKATLPQSIDFGYSFRPTRKLILNADLMWTDWASTKKEELAYPSETDSTGGAWGVGKLGFLNNGNPANRDWHSAWSLGLGGEYKVADNFRLRGGYYYHQSPIPQDTWEPCLPDSDSHSIATGFGYDITKALTVDMTYSAMLYKARSIKNDADPAYGQTDEKYRQWVNLVLATARYKF